MGLGVSCAVVPSLVAYLLFDISLDMYISFEETCRTKCFIAESRDIMQDTPRCPY